MLKYFFYDMDDTLVDTRGNWIGAIKEYLSLQGLPCSEEIIVSCLGKNCRDICISIDARYGHIGKGNVERHADVFRKCLIDQFNRKMPNEIRGAGRFLGLMNGSVGQYIVSGSPIKIIDHVIRHNGWSPYIAGFSSSETVPRGKPDPRIYDDMRERLGAKRDECLIFEDSPVGVEAARRAGIRTVCVNPHVSVDKSAFLLCSVADFLALIDGNTIGDLLRLESSHELN